MQTVGLGSLGDFPAVITTETFEATDAAGNSATGSFTVTVNDNEDPVPVLPADIVSSDPGVCEAEVTYLVDATDSSGATIALTSGSGSGAGGPCHHRDLHCDRREPSDFSTTSAAAETAA